MKEAFVRSLVSAVPWGLRSRVRSIPGIAQAQRWIVSRTLEGMEFEHRVNAGPAKGVRFWIRMPEDKGIWTGAYEQVFAEKLAAAIYPGAVAYDIGGWHGFFAGVMAAQGASRVVVFEPFPANIARIDRLIALNSGLPLDLQPLALSDFDGTAEMLVMPQTSMAKLAASDFQPEAASGGSILVRTSRMDTLVSSGAIPPPNVMKLDVEGAELFVLKGAKTVLEKYRPAIFAEVHSFELLREVRSLLDSCRYTVTQINQDVAAPRDIFQIHACPACQ